jgi:hypothetical protein
MESLDRSKAVIDLGKRIVTGLKLGDDVVAQWMAHLVAEKIFAAEQAPEDTRDIAENACVETILKLWANRYALPPYMRPLRELSQSQQVFHIKNSFCKLNRSCQGCG